MNGDRISLSDIKKVENLLNHRPRKRLNYLTPYEVFVEKKKIRPKCCTSKVNSSLFDNIKNN